MLDPKVQQKPDESIRSKFKPKVQIRKLAGAGKLSHFPRRKSNAEGPYVLDPSHRAEHVRRRWDKPLLGKPWFLALKLSTRSLWTLKPQILLVLVLLPLILLVLLLVFLLLFLLLLHHHYYSHVPGQCVQNPSCHTNPTRSLHYRGVNSYLYEFHVCLTYPVPYVYKYS